MIIFLLTALFRLSEDSVHKQPGGLYKLVRKDSYWHLLHKMRDVVGHHREELNRVMNQETWQVVHRFDTQERELEEFKERCDQYQTDPKVILCVVPLCIIKEEEGQVVKTMTGRRFTTIRFQEDNIDVRTNETELTDEEIDKKLRDVFGIKLEKPLKIVDIMAKLTNKEK